MPDFVYGLGFDPSDIVRGTLEAGASLDRLEKLGQAVEDRFAAVERAVAAYAAAARTGAGSLEVFERYQRMANAAAEESISRLAMETGAHERLTAAVERSTQAMMDRATASARMIEGMSAAGIEAAAVHPMARAMGDNPWAAAANVGVNPMAAQMSKGFIPPEGLDAWDQGLLRLEETQDALNGLTAGMQAMNGASLHAGHGLGRVTQALAGMAVHMVGLNPKIATLTSGLMHFAVGGMVTLGVIAGLAAIFLAIDKLTEGFQKAMGRVDEFADAFKKRQAAMKWEVTPRLAAADIEKDAKRVIAAMEQVERAQKILRFGPGPWAAFLPLGNAIEWWTGDPAKKVKAAQDAVTEANIRANAAGVAHAQTMTALRIEQRHGAAAAEQWINGLKGISVAATKAEQDLSALLARQKEINADIRAGWLQVGAALDAAAVAQARAQGGKQAGWAEQFRREHPQLQGGDLDRATALFVQGQAKAEAYGKAVARAEQYTEDLAQKTRELRYIGMDWDPAASAIQAALRHMDALHVTVNSPRWRAYMDIVTQTTAAVRAHAKAEEDRKYAMDQSVERLRNVFTLLMRPVQQAGEEEFDRQRRIREERSVVDTRRPWLDTEVQALNEYVSSLNEAAEAWRLFGTQRGDALKQSVEWQRALRIDAERERSERLWERPSQGLLPSETQRLADAYWKEQAAKGPLVAAENEWTRQQKLMEQTGAKAADAAKVWETAWKRGIENMQDALGTFFDTLGQDGLKSVRNFANEVLTVFRRLAAQIAAMQIWKIITGMFTSSVSSVSPESGSMNYGGQGVAPGATAGGYIGIPAGGVVGTAGGSSAFNFPGTWTDVRPSIASVPSITTARPTFNVGNTRMPDVGATNVTIHMRNDLSAQSLDPRTHAVLLQQQVGTLANMMGKVFMEVPAMRRLAQAKP